MSTEIEKKRFFSDKIDIIILSSLFEIKLFAHNVFCYHKIAKS